MKKDGIVDKSPGSYAIRNKQVFHFCVPFLFTFVTFLLDYFEQTNFAIYLFFVFLICAPSIYAKERFQSHRVLQALFFATSNAGENIGKTHLPAFANVEGVCFIKQENKLVKHYVPAGHFFFS